MKCIFGSLLSFFILSSASASDILGPNFHEIDRGRYYRSAQLDGKEFDYYIKKYGIRTIINLRGAYPDEKWYKEEKQVAAKNGVEHHDISMLAEAIPHRQNLIKLLDLFKTAQRPILVHCQGGADRTGEASTLYQMLYNGKPMDEALKMLTFKYRHAEFFKPAKRYFIEQVWQGEDWAYKSYDPCKSNYKYYERNTEYCRN
ncbi:tyrosine-protein phosphatase [Bdellovibrio sp. HCB337]|uniref:tyrosine-protein phosphatase n=1 Tax=Bdellovibrio sp. HCB337 TaxID=3394358 RepID=UPI0039A426A0